MYTTKQRLFTKMTAGVLSAVMSVSALSSGIGAFAEEYGGIKYQSNGVHLGMSGDEFLDEDTCSYGSVPPEIAPIIDAGISALGDLIPGGSIVTGYLSLILDNLLGGDDPDPTAASINDLREEINSRLDEIESRMESDKNEILDQFTNDLYTQGLGHA
ncbi:MAG: hypothetical protein II695_02560, partial [Oscillospiraceae bacterium]|nr:hypothetical protein [Oscillospiraceae bacterium]